MAKTIPINIANPAGTSDPRLGDNYIRILAQAVVELINKDHYVGGQINNAYDEDAAGEHAKVTLNAPLADHPTSEANKAHLYIKDVSSIAELFFRDENGKSIQISKYLPDLAAAVQSILLDNGVLSNDTYLKAMNSTGNALVNLIKVDAASVVTLSDGAALAAATESGDNDLTIADKKYVDDLTAGSSEQTANATGVTLAVQDTWYEVAKISAFDCGGKDVLINCVASSINGAGNGLFEARLLIGATQKIIVATIEGYNSQQSLSITWLEKSCVGINDLIFQWRAVHAATVGTVVNKVDYPSIINAVRFPWAS